MDDTKSPTSSMESTGDTSRLLKELIDLQKSSASSMASIDRSINVQESHEVLQTISGMAQTSGDGTDPTLTELMKTMYDGNSARQLITLQGTDTANSFSVFGQEVDIVSSKQLNKSQSLAGSTGSNKVKITPVVNYDWENRRYVGNLVAVHRGNIFVAYVLKGKTGGVVRITNRKTAERHLLKDFVGRVIDLAFAHTDDVMLAVVDEIGNLCVYEIHQADDRKISSTRMLHVQRPQTSLVSEYHRVIWCPYIPDEVDETATSDCSTPDSASRMLVLTNDQQAEIWSVDMVTREYGDGPMFPQDVEIGLITIDSHSKPITDAAFSPDGTALATASLDGEVMFFQVHMYSQDMTSPRCLHQWKPHNGKPMSCLFFLDDHKNCSPDALFWKFAVTGADNNQEIKIWSCDSWNCLQTIRFLSPPGVPSNFTYEPCMKASLDMSARFLILSDIRKNVLYVLQIHHAGDQSSVHVSSVSEFTLAQPCLSFAILDAGTKRFKISKGDDSHLDEITTGDIVPDDGEEDEKRSDTGASSLGVQIKLYTVHPKALQELLIRFKPESSAPVPPAPSVSSVSQSEAGVVDGLSDMSMSVDGSGEHDKSDSFSTPLAESTHTGQHILLTPDAFVSSSPRKLQAAVYTDESILDNSTAKSSTSSFTQVSAMNDDFLSPRSSSNSTITQTPTTPKAENLSPGLGLAIEVTPSSVPLPPITSIEETDLATPTSSGSRDLRVGDATPTPEETQEVDNFFQQSGERKRDLQMVSLDSTESTGMFEAVASGVSSVEVSRVKKSQSSYDENDEEVADVLGDDTIGDSTPMGTQPFDGFQDGSQLGESGESSIRAWPKPPKMSKGESDPALQAGQGDSHISLDEGDDNEADEDEEEEENEDNDEDDGDDGGEDDADVVVEEEETEGEAQEEEEEIVEEIEEEQEPSDESLDSKRGPMPAPVAGAGFSQSPREPRPVEVREIHKETVREVLDTKEMKKLHTGLECVLQAMERQQQQLDLLRRDITEQQDNFLELQRRQHEQEQLRTVPDGNQPSIEEHLGKLENIVTSRVERLFNQHSQKEAQRVQDILRQSDARDERKHERLCSSVTQTISASVNTQLDKLVRSQLVPNMTKVLEPIKEQMHHDMAQKLTATDSLLKDNIAKMVRSRPTVEAMGVAAGNAIQAPIQAAYREAFQNFVIPTFERTTQNMYQQVSETFQRGTKEYTRQLESHLEGVRQRHQEGRDPVVMEMRRLSDSFQASAEQMQAHVLASIQTQLSSEISKTMTRLQESLGEHVHAAVREEVGKAMKEQGSTISDNVLLAMRSGAVTPARVTPDPQIEKTHILNLLRQGQLNAAFQQALSAANLELVIALCEAVNPNQVFNQSPCPLQQPVLLSLIQQLSADLENHTELKHKYLEEAVMNLDIHDSITQEHMRGVLLSLNQKLRVYIPAHPNLKITRSLRMLLMASESLIK
ncbi:enhancer of mRNA-decapping protein 4-like [Mya arenaria]|uniref:enhancer of mRNA-decapping protein 4-like n=1 Tax=Mya arenaria TaxID=6604 RepID=UPI0022E34F40|nr:enhancer of mRNA-decapping protein 4-like [Mya arenaria]